MAQEMALRALARREYARPELVARLEMRGVDGAAARAVVDALAAQGLQSDERYAAALVEARRRRGYGPLRVAAELRAAGVEADIADSAVAFEAPAWTEACRRWCARHARGRGRAVLERTLRTRGFTAAQLRGVLQDDTR